MKLAIPMMFLSVILMFQVKAQEKKEGSDVFAIVDEMPEYPGGDETLRKDISESVKYPAEAHKKGIAGKIYITFIVNETGKIEDPKIVRGVHPLLDKEALRVMSLLKTWSPGKQDGKTVKVSYTVPIKFALATADESKNELKH